MGSSVPHHRKKATVPLLYGQQHLLGLQHAENIMAIRHAFAKKQIQMIASCQFFDLTATHSIWRHRSSAPSSSRYCGFQQQFARDARFHLIHSLPSPNNHCFISIAPLLCPMESPDRFSLVIPASVIISHKIFLYSIPYKSFCPRKRLTSRTSVVWIRPHFQRLE